MGRRRTRRPTHAEGGRGRKTETRTIEKLESGQTDARVDARLEHDRSVAAPEGTRRLVEDQMQHGEAEKNGEHRRLFEDTRRGRTNGPSDDSGSLHLHGVLGNREHRAGYKERGPDSLAMTGRP